MRALITGVTGQDGSYLAEQLALAGHEVFGLVRGQAVTGRRRLAALVPQITLLDGDLQDGPSLLRAVETAAPDAVFNLAAVTQIGMSWGQPELMTSVTGLGVLRLLEAVRRVAPAARFVQASSADMFGDVAGPVAEDGPVRPLSPYGAAKAYAHHLVQQYRDGYGLHASTAIMFNHTSPRHGAEFVVRKIVSGAVECLYGAEKELRLGYLDASRDWGWAPDYMTAWPLIAAQDEPGDWVLATGKAHSLRDLCQAAFAAVGLDWARYVVHDPSLVRPADVRVRIGDAGKARRALGWEPTLQFDEIVRRLVEDEDP